MYNDRRGSRCMGTLIGQPVPLEGMGDVDGHENSYGVIPIRSLVRREPLVGYREVPKLKVFLKAKGAAPKTFSPYLGSEPTRILFCSGFIKGEPLPVINDPYK